MPEDQAAAVRGTIEQWRQAQEVRSVDGLAQAYAQDDALVLVQQGVVTRGWTAVSALLQAQLGTASAVHVRLQDLTVTPLGGQGAAVSAHMTREIATGATSVTEDGALTLALALRGAAWIITSQHYSYPVR